VRSARRPSRPAASDTPYTGRSRIDSVVVTPREEIAKGYDLDDEAVRAAVAYEEQFRS